MVSDTQQQPKDESKPKMVIIAAIIFLVIIAIFVTNSLFHFLPANWNLLKGQQTAQTKPAQSEAIAKVGEETIYAKDLKTEMEYSPQKRDQEAKYLLEKMVTDSIILQGASADKAITLDSTIYNSPNINYLQRIKTVASAKEIISGQADGIEGSFVSIWFFNTKAGAAGYEAGKKIALAKITKLWNDVKSKKVTIEQAGEQIKNDTSLKQVDTAYAANAIYKFTTPKGEKITFSPEFDAALWKLKAGEVSDIFLAKDDNPKTKQKIDAVYIFGQVDKINDAGKVKNFNDWVSEKRKIYEVIYY